MNFNFVYENYKNLIEEELLKFANDLNCHDELKASMSYSLLAGGKRIRPVMFLACLDMLGVDYKKYLPLAVAIECIHTYSLIHDDLPSMDNDDFRRGKPSNHKVFGEGIAILAGDGLLNSAVELALNSIDGENTLNAVKYLIQCSGTNGMINGQAYDLYYEDKEIPDKQNVLHVMQLNKTGKLLTAPLVMASYIAGEKHLNELMQIGELTGRLFQFSDDLLDVKGSFELVGKTLGKDDYANKLTAISVYGVSECERVIQSTYLSIIKILKTIDNSLFFENFYTYIKDRKN